ncbi:MAG: AbrB/MazE/SpoVT family DNA-binding domain-containing protein [Candidatus Diapherotrites archaeon]
MDTDSARVDSKGRIVIPDSFRKSLGIRQGEKIVIELDKQNERMLLFPIEKATRKIEITISDVPGSLAKAAQILFRNNVDLVYTESRSVSRAKEAVWTVVANFSKTDLVKLKKELSQEKKITKFKFFF